MTTRVKKFLASFVAVMFALSLAACSSEEATVSKTLVFENEIINVEMTIDAKGDVVQKITQDMTLDVSNVTDTAALDAAREQAASTEEKLAAIEGSEYSFTEENNVMTEHIVLPVHTKELLTQTLEAGLLPVAGDATTIETLSLKQTVESLTAEGWTEK